MPAGYYREILYPLQDKVVLTFNSSPFYLTGGTALSRGYYNHRYSDDLDYFVNDHFDFRRIFERQVEKLKEVFSDVKVAFVDVNFCRVFVGQEKLKIEMVNDVPAHTGELVEHPILGRMDSKENIFANKITAIMDRRMPKDIVDIFFLLKDGLDIKKALLDAHSKAAGIAPLFLAKILSEFDFSLIDSQIKWIKPVESKTIKQFLQDFSLRIVKGEIK